MNKVFLGMLFFFSVIIPAEKSSLTDKEKKAVYDYVPFFKTYVDQLAASLKENREPAQMRKARILPLLALLNDKQQEDVRKELRQQLSRICSFRMINYLKNMQLEDLVSFGPETKGVEVETTCMFPDKNKFYAACDNQGLFHYNPKNNWEKKEIAQPFWQRQLDQDDEVFPIMAKTENGKRWASLASHPSQLNIYDVDSKLTQQITLPGPIRQCTADQNGNFFVIYKKNQSRYLVPILKLNIADQKTTTYVLAEKKALTDVDTVLLHMYKSELWTIKRNHDGLRFTVKTFALANDSHLEFNDDLQVKFIKNEFRASFEEDPVIVVHPLNECVVALNRYGQYIAKNNKGTRYSYFLPKNAFELPHAKCLTDIIIFNDDNKQNSAIYIADVHTGIGLRMLNLGILNGYVVSTRHFSGRLWEGHRLFQLSEEKIAAYKSAFHQLSLKAQLMLENNNKNEPSNENS
jgi:hypothetical protein